MKEIKLHIFSGKVVTCFSHGRIFEIQPEDEIISTKRNRYKSTGQFNYYQYSVKCPCGCEVAIENSKLF